MKKLLCAFYTLEAVLLFQHFDSLQQHPADRGLNSQFFSHSYHAPCKHIDLRFMSCFQILERRRLVIIWDSADRIVLLSHLLFRYNDSFCCRYRLNFLHCRPADFIGRFAAAECTEGNPQQCTGQVFPDIAHIFKPKPPHHIFFYFIWDITAFHQFADRLYPLCLDSIF